ncbi:hypothetical protein BGX23_011414 [Mortierella sp. AD031]|nr:hypothetical protein BGX23_011414 [Mortierella sp. AD031]
MRFRFLKNLVEAPLLLKTLACLPNLTRLENTVTTTSNLQVILELLPRLQHYTFPTIATVLVRDCQRLESTKLSAKRSDSSDALVTLLHGCPRLKSLDALRQMVDAGQLLETPIVCRELEVFRCQVVGMGRLTVKEEATYNDWSALRIETEKEDGGATTDTLARQIKSTMFLRTPEEAERASEVLAILEKHKQSQEQHQRIYDQFGQLTKLRILEVGVNTKDGEEIFNNFPDTYLVEDRRYFEGYGPTPNTLELSLHSGLERLGSLKDLEVFGFDGVDHRIQIEELTWMRWGMQV